MKTLIPDVHLVDNLLSPEDALLVLEHSRTQIYHDTHSMYCFFRPDISDGYRVFKQRDGYSTNKEEADALHILPTGSPIDCVVEEARRLIGANDTASVRCSFVIMPNGAKSGIHIDAAHKAAFIYYLDREWTFENGGELICYPGLQISHEEFNEILLGRRLDQQRFADNCGYAIAPIFNRLVVFKTGIPHRVTRTENYIGVGRIALIGFFD